MARASSPSSRRQSRTARDHDESKSPAGRRSQRIRQGLCPGAGNAGTRARRQGAVAYRHQRRRSRPSGILARLPDRPQARLRTRHRGNQPEAPRSRPRVRARHRVDRERQHDSAPHASGAQVSSPGAPPRRLLRRRYVPGAQPVAPLHGGAWTLRLRVHHQSGQRGVGRARVPGRLPRGAGRQGV